MLLFMFHRYDVMPCKLLCELTGFHESNSEVCCFSNVMPYSQLLPMFLEECTVSIFKMEGCQKSLSLLIPKILNLRTCDLPIMSILKGSNSGV
jgi:hypothetical protein